MIRKLLLIGAAAAALASPATAATLIVGARVVDGAGGPPRNASVRFDRGVILAVGDIAPTPGDEVVDAKGLVLAPGFIDTHSHHDEGLAEHPEAAVVVSQGVTTIVVGQDGASALPLAKAFARLEQDPAAVNVASYTGHNTIREKVMGADYRRAASPAEIEAMAALVRAEMDAGAIGLSTGLEYDRGIYASPEEVSTLAVVAAKSGGRYISHIRSEDRKLAEALGEVVAIGRATAAPVQVSHFKLAMVQLWGEADAYLARLDAARRAGVAVTADVYPYEYWQSTLTVMFPERNFKDRAAAEAALASLAPPEGLRLSRFEPDPSLVGRTVAEISAARGTDPAQALMDLIAEAGPDGAGVREMVIGTSMDAADVAKLIAWPHANICSDGAIGDLHPRGAGAFTKVLRKYVREDGVLTLEAAVRKMSGLAADHIGIRDRGYIRPGLAADLVLFDPAMVADRATIEEPQALSVGVDRVWVNGELVWANGAPTGARPGRVIRRRSP